MKRREMLKRALGVTLGGGLLSASGSQAPTDRITAPVPANYQHAYLVESEGWWRSVEVELWSKNFLLNKSSYRLRAFYCSEPPRPMVASLAMGYLSPIVPSKSNLALDRMRYLSCVATAEYQSVVALKSVHLPEGQTRTHYAVFSELTSNISLAVLQNPCILAAYDILDPNLKLRPYNDTKIVVRSDHMWNRRSYGPDDSSSDSRASYYESIRRRHDRELFYLLKNSLA